MDPNTLLKKKCVPCEIGTPPMPIEEAKKYLNEMSGWLLLGNKITKDYKFPDFKTALDFVNQIGKVAESEGHHPDILLSWGRVNVSLITHKAHGLTENDFIMATKIDHLKTS